MHYPPKWHMLVIHAAGAQEMLVKQAQDVLKYKILTQPDNEKAVCRSSVRQMRQFLKSMTFIGKCCM